MHRDIMLGGGQNSIRHVHEPSAQDRDVDPGKIRIESYNSRSTNGTEMVADRNVVRSWAVASSPLTCERIPMLNPSWRSCRGGSGPS
jgi:hypothetical protein